jgi:sugar/nucleoside kinase (ribokinase family)
MTGEDDCEAGLAKLARQVPLLVVTRSEKGALAVSGGERVGVPAEPVEAVVDTTGAGDQFAAGFLAGHVRGESLETCLRMGAIAAAEVIGHIGPRPEVDVGALIAERLG